MSVIKEFLFGLGWKVDNSGLDEAEKKALASAKRTTDEWKKAGAQISKSIAVVGAVAVGAAAGIFKFAESTAAAGDRVAKTAKQAGVAANELQRMEFAIERSGGSAQGLSKAVRTMTLNLENAAQKGSGPLAEGLAQVGLKAEDLLNLSLEEKMSKISEALRGVGDESRRSGLAMQIFGAKGGAELKPLLDEGAAGIKALGDEAERLGLVMSDDALKASEEFTDAVLDMKSTLKALARDVGISILPAVQTMIGKVKEWAVQNRELIATKAQDFIEQVMRALEQLLPALLQILPLMAQLAGLGTELVGALGPGGATAAMIAFKTSMSGALGPAGLLATAIATITSALINMAVEAQDAKFTLDDLLQGGRGKRGEGGRFVASKREGQLQAQRRALASRVKDLTGRNSLKNALKDGEEFPQDQRGVIALGARAKAQRAATMARIKEIDAEIAKERQAGEVRDRQEEAEINTFVGPSLLDAGSDRVKKPKGARKPKPTDVSQAEGIFGERIRKLAARGGVGETAIRSALEAGQSSLSSGAAEKVALKAALGRLGSLTGQDLTTERKGGDPLMSAILGDENVPDINLSSIARGANPQTLISNITNNVTVTTHQHIEGAGNPEEVASKSAAGIRDHFSEAMGKASKTAKVAYLR